MWGGCHAQWVVTEFGAVNLHGLALRERGEALISIAHPDFRAELRRNLGAIRHVAGPPRPESVEEEMVS